MPVDPDIWRYATEREREYLLAIEQYPSYREAARALGVSHSAISRAISAAAKRVALMTEHQERPVGATTPQPVDVLPPDDVETEDLIDMMVRRYRSRAANKEARTWRRFRVPVSGPYGLMFFGDPHVDDNGCNWPLLREHCALAASTPALYGVAIGDQSNNWTGRLARLWADQDTSAQTARKLVKWLLADSGVPWFLWLSGNHDAWMGPVNSAVVEGMNLHNVPMEDWQAQVVLESEGFDLRLWASHNFPGHSMYNRLHGPQKAAMMKDWAHIYVAGHHHNWALHHEENPDRGFTYWLARCRGYKHLDSHADHLGYASQSHGSSIVAVIDPAENGTGRVTCFADPQVGVDFLNFKRRRL